MHTTGELFFQPPVSRIRGCVVPAFFPESGPVHTLLYGEAPGPRGADQSGVPFWGDGAGIPLYRALAAARCADVPEAAWSEWDGGTFVKLGLRPVLHGVALSNAFPQCPTNDGCKFRAPTRAELRSHENLQRLAEELERATTIGLKQVITLGRCARDTVAPIAQTFGVPLVALPHPAAQGLLADAPNRGRGLRLADLQIAWQNRLVQLLSATRDGDIFATTPV
jgi:uracil-DNA glycosylase